MDIDEALRLRLVNDVTIGAGARVWSSVLKEKPTPPAITYQQVSGNPVENILGSSNIAIPCFQVTAWSTTIVEARAVAKRIKQSLQGFSGIMGGTGGVYVGAVNARGGVDLRNPDTDWRGHAIDYFITHNE